MEINRIILVTKFKASSERALTRALMLAREHNAHFEILNVIDPPEQKGISIKDKVSALDHSLQQLIDHEKTMRQIIKRAGDHPWTPEAHITMENPNKVKERLMTITDKDFLVVGFGDWSGQLDLSPYITPANPVTPPACPIWLVPVRAKKNLKKQMLLLADGNGEPEQLKNLGRICEVALNKKMSLEVLATSDEIMHHWDYWLRELGIEGYTLERIEDKASLPDVISDRKPGLLGILIQSSLTAETLRRMDTFSREDLVVI